MRAVPIHLVVFVSCLGACGGLPVEDVAPRASPRIPSFLTPDAAPLPARVPDASPANGAVHFLRAHRAPIVAVATSHDGRLVASASEEGTVVVADVETGLVRTAARMAVGDKALAFSSAGPFLMVASSENDQEPGEVVLWDLRSDTRTTLTANAGFFAGVAVWSPSGDQVAYLAWVSEGRVDTMHVRVFGLAEGRDVVDVALELGERATALALSASGDALAMADERGTLRVYDVPGGQLRARVAAPDAREAPEEPAELAREMEAAAEAGGNRYVLPAPYWWELLYRPTGGALVAMRGDGLLRVLAPTSGALVREIRLEPLREGERLVWTGDGRVFGVLRRSGPPLDTWDGATGEPRAERWAREDVDRHFPPDRARSDGTSVVVRDADGRERAFEHGAGEHSVWGASFTPSGRALLTRGRGGVELWSGAGARTVGCVEGESAVSFVDETHVTQFGGGACNLLTDEGQPGNQYAEPEDDEHGEDQEYGEETEDDPDARPRTICPSEGPLCLRDDGHGLQRVASGGSARLPTTGTPVAHSTGVRTHPLGVRWSTTRAFFSLHIEDELRVWELATGRLIARVPHERLISWAPDDAWFLAATTIESDDVTQATTLQLVDARTGRVRPPFALEAPLSRAALAAQLVVAPGNRGLLVLEAERTTLLDTAGARPARSFASVGAPVRGGWLDATTAWARREGRFEVLSIEGAQSSWNLPGRGLAQPSGAFAFQCSPADTIRVFDLRTGQNARSYALPGCRPEQPLTVSTDGQFVAAWKGTTTHVLRVSDGASLTLRVLRSETGTVPVAYAASAVFRAPEGSLDQLAVRRPGDAAHVPLLTSNAARALLRPALLEDFFAGRPLPEP